MKNPAPQTLTNKTNFINPCFFFVEDDDDFPSFGMYSDFFSSLSTSSAPLAAASFSFFAISLLVSLFLSDGDGS
ncbi:hypothetical protein FRACYDRAFT_269164, partial [Fragilariopsis cylindrus CCMP1102]